MIRRAIMIAAVLAAFLAAGRADYADAERAEWRAAPTAAVTSKRERIFLALPCARPSDIDAIRHRSWRRIAHRWHVVPGGVVVRRLQGHGRWTAAGWCE